MKIKGEMTLSGYEMCFRDLASVLINLKVIGSAYTVWGIDSNSIGIYALEYGGGVK